MVSVRLPDAVSSLVEQLQRGVEDFDSLARKLENEVDAPGEGGRVLVVVDRIRKLDRKLELTAIDIQDLHNSKQELVLATHDALSNAKTVLGHLMEAIGSSSIGADTVYGELEDQQLRGSALNGLTDAIAEWQAATSADQPSASTHT